MHVSEFRDDEATAQRAREVIEMLAAELDLLDPSVVTASPDLFSVAWGWWARICRTARAVNVLAAEGLLHEAAPLVRVVIEHSIGLVWLTDVGDPGYASIIARHHKHMENVRASANKADWIIDVPDSTSSDSAQLPTDEDLKYPRSFETMLDDYELGTLYTVYRVESAYNHPTYAGARPYLQQRDDALQILTTPESPSRAIQIETARSLIIATMAVDRLLDGRPLQPRTRAASSLLGVPHELPARKPNRGPTTKE